LNTYISASGAIPIQSGFQDPITLVIKVP